MAPPTALLAAFALAGCLSLPVPARPGPQATLPEELAGRYAYAPLPLQARAFEVRGEDGYSVRKLELAPAGIRADWYKPDRRGRLPAVLISPILAGNDLYIREFARFYASRGMHALIVYRPRELFSTDRELAQVEKHFQESVVQLRQALDWLEAQESVDPGAIGSFAISLGAILTTILAAVEPRVRASVLGLPAGKVAEVIMTSRDKAIRKRRRSYLEKRGWDERQGLKEMEKAIVSEPMRFAPAIDPGRVLMISAVFDRVLGLGRSMALWRAMGRPRLILLPTGHYTAAAATPYLKAAAYSFLRRRLRRTDAPGRSSRTSP